MIHLFHIAKIYRGLSTWDWSPFPFSIRYAVYYQCAIYWKITWQCIFDRKQKWRSISCTQGPVAKSSIAYRKELTIHHIICLHEIYFVKDWIIGLIHNLDNSSLSGTSGMDARGGITSLSSKDFKIPRKNNNHSKIHGNTPSFLCIGFLYGSFPKKSKFLSTYAKKIPIKI